MCHFCYAGCYFVGLCDGGGGGDGVPGTGSDALCEFRKLSPLTDGMSLVYYSLNRQIEQQTVTECGNKLFVLCVTSTHPHRVGQVVSRVCRGWACRKHLASLGAVWLASDSHAQASTPERTLAHSTFSVRMGSIAC